MYKVYFLQSEKGEHFYIGLTAILESRLMKHNNGSSKSTKPYRPWKVIYTEEYSNKEEAAKREFYFKSPNGYIEKKAIIDKYKKLYP